MGKTWKQSIEDWEEQLIREATAIKRMQNEFGGNEKAARGSRLLRVKRTHRGSYVATVRNKDKVANWA